MSQDVNATALITIAKKGLRRTKAKPESPYLPDSPGPRLETEVVSDEDLRFEQALARRTQSPSDFIREASRIQSPLIKGALVNVETLLGFLAAMETILPPESNYPLLTSAKIWFQPSDHPKVFLEGGSHSVWTAVALDAEAFVKEDFQALLPVRRAKNVLRATSSAQKQVMVGVDSGGVCLGAHAIPFGGMLKDFPAQPVIVNPIARAAMPAFYYQEIVDRVMPARSLRGIESIGTQGVLLDFDVQEIDGSHLPVCTAVARDGARMHILRLPRMMMEIKGSRMPPAVKVSAGFFRYMKAIANHEWVGMEFGDRQLVAKGKDFITVAQVEVASELSAWRQDDVEYPGSWMVDSETLEEAVNGVPGRNLRMVVDSMFNRITVGGEASDGTRYRKRVTARRHGGAAHVDVELTKKYLLDAIQSCATQLVRLSFEHNKKYQRSAAVVIRGEDEQFKAVVKPVVEGEDNAQP